MTWLHLVLSLLLLLAPPLPTEDPPEVPAPAAIPEGMVDCPTCEDGTAELPCRHCGGVGDVFCVTCTTGLKMVESLRPAWNETFQLGAGDDVYQTIEDIKGPWLKMVIGGEGYLSCNGGPGLGTIYAAVNHGWECKRCDTTFQVRCPDCKEGTWTCRPCKGKGKEVRACGDCNGEAVLPDPALRAKGDLQTCGWCEGLGSRFCSELGGKVHEGEAKDVPCFVCKGKKKRSCSRCAGSKKVACSACQGFGKVVSKIVYGQDPKFKKCGACRGSGLDKCTSCKGKGKIECVTCDGRGKLEPQCYLCLGDGRVACVGCFRSSARSWEVEAQVLEAAGLYEEAARRYDVVAARLNAHAAERLAFEEAAGFDYVFGRKTEGDEVATDCQQRQWAAEGKARQLRAAAK